MDSDEEWEEEEPGESLSHSEGVRDALFFSYSTFGLFLFAFMSRVNRLQRHGNVIQDKLCAFL